LRFTRLFVFFFVECPSHVIERNLTELCHMIGREPGLKVDVRKWGFSPSNGQTWPPKLLIFGGLRRHRDLSANMLWNERCY